MLELRSIFDYPKGTLESLLTAAYAALHEGRPEYAAENHAKFRECDEFFYGTPEIGGRCARVGVEGDRLVGMCSWDPREWPVVVVGHNCVLPERRSQGFGSRQLREALAILRSEGFTRARVSTGLMDFFAPARLMYAAVGFVETRRDGSGDSLEPKLHDQVYYEMDLVSR
jgi:GNAT superfamily N-acetyltransferase